jgi:hypothetical protein
MHLMKETFCATYISSYDMIMLSVVNMDTVKSTALTKGFFSMSHLHCYILVITGIINCTD